MSIFAHICHQQDERCFHFRSAPMPLCSRCLGFYLSFFLALALGAVLESPYRLLARETPLVIFGTFILLQIPLMADGMLQYHTRYRSNNGRRFFTGTLSGTGSALFLLWWILLLF